MACEICGREGSHAFMCPYYSPRKTEHYCSSCGEGIQEGEEYIENDASEFRHYDCFYGMRDLLEWLGYKVKTAEEISDTYEMDY